MEMFRELAVEISKRESFSSSQLVTIYCSYTRGLEATSTDRKGGINITTDDSKFIQFLVEKLLAHPEELVALTCKQIAFFLQACNRLNYDNEELLHHIGKTVLAKEKEFQPKEWSMIVAGKFLSLHRRHGCRVTERRGREEQEEEEEAKKQRVQMEKKVWGRHGGRKEEDKESGGYNTYVQGCHLKRKKKN